MTPTLSAFHTLVADEWDFRLREDPLFATQVGDARYNHRLPASAAGDFERRLAALRQFRARLENINRTELPVAEQLNFDIFSRWLDNEIGELVHRAYLVPISKAFGFHTYFPELPAFVPLSTTVDYENYVARLEAFHRWTEEQVDLMAVGLRDGFRPARVTLDGVAEAAAAQVVEPAASPLYQPFTAFPPTVPEADRARLAAAGLHALRVSVIPAYQALELFLREAYIPAARDTVAAADLPNGAAFYRHRIRYYTSLNLTAEDIHSTGHTEVARIRADMESLVVRSGFSGNLREFIQYLRTDPRFYASSAEALLKETAYVLKRMDGELPRLFQTLPRLPYGIRAIPEYAAAGNTTAYYQLGSGDGTRAGQYYVNTTDLASRPLFEIEALSLHEAVPGHHLQLALQQELGDLPLFRRFSGFTAFVEGWALYAERLGLEVGFYTDLYSDFGRLSYEMWRACRLVVDTGLHAFGWTRQQAIDFMAENTSSTLLNIANEVDRYIAWPGQALAYKIGELKIRALRARAEAALGPAFDVRAFHDVLLRQGAVPLDVLEHLVTTWMAARQPGRPTPN